MTNFSYEGLDENGRTVAGEMAADDETALESRLRTMGLWLIEAKASQRPASKENKNSFLSAVGAPTRRDIIDFCTLMNFQLRAGVSMIAALDVAASDCPNPRFREAITDLRRMVESGEGLADGMARTPRMFPDHVVSLIRSAESSGRVPEAFLEISRYLEWQEQIMSDVRQATIYPAIVLSVVAGFVFILFTFVVPKFVGLLAMAKVGLPLITRFVFSLSDVAKATWWIYPIVFLGIPAVVKGTQRRSPRFAAAFEQFKFRIPIFGQLIHMLVISRLAHNLAVLYRSGITLLNALELCRELVGSIAVSNSLVDVIQRIEAGESLSDGLRRHPVFPPLLIRMVAMGERSGSLDGALENVSTYYDAIIPRRIKKVFSLLEPVLIIGLVAIVGTVAMAIFLPILQLMSAIK
jgi:type IV pilus assembly protein PilC